MAKKRSIKNMIPLFIFLAGILAIVIAIVATPTKFYGNEREDGTYDLEIGMVNRVTKTVTVPAEFEGKKVTSFLVEAWDSDTTYDKITTLVLSEGIEEINLPLLDCLPFLERIELPSTIKAVYGVISDEVEVVIADGADVELKNGCFINKKTMTVMGAQFNATIPDGVKVIAEKAFYGAELKTLDIPASVERIEASAFGGVTVAQPFELNLHSGIKYVGPGAFAAKVTIEKVTISTKIKLPSSLFGSSKRGGAAIKSFVLDAQPNIVKSLSDNNPDSYYFEVSSVNNANVLRYVYVKDGVALRNLDGEVAPVKYKKLSESDIDGYTKYTVAEFDESQKDNNKAYTFLSFIYSTSDY